jgi:uncharacterized protein YdeI (YjbR/CyaY-like superfamily)
MDTLSFKSDREFRAWLEQNHDRDEGIWLRIYKKGYSGSSVSFSEALDQALCFGWIDGRKMHFDQDSWLQRFTPRRSKSSWSKINIGNANRLIDTGQMTPAGMKAIEAAKADGRWGAAYDSFSNSRIPEDFLKELDKDKKAKAFFETLNRTNLYSIAYRLQTAKTPEARERRMELILGMLSRGIKFH